MPAAVWQSWSLPHSAGPLSVSSGAGWRLQTLTSSVLPRLPPQQNTQFSNSLFSGGRPGPPAAPPRPPPVWSPSGGGGPALGSGAAPGPTAPTVWDSSKLANRKMRILANANHSFPLPNYCAITEYCNALVTAIRNLLNSNIAALARSRAVLLLQGTFLGCRLQTSGVHPARLARRSPCGAAVPGNVLPGYLSSQPLGFPRSGGRAQRPERRCW